MSVAGICCLHAQSNVEHEALFDDAIENLLEETNEGEALDGNIYEEALQDLVSFAEEPLDLNTAAHEDLSLFPFLSEMQITELLLWRKKYGALRSVQELRLIRAFDYETIRRLLPYVQVIYTQNTMSLWRDLDSLWRKGHHQLLARTDIPLFTRAGYKDGRYKGANLSHSLRYQYRTGTRFRFGITASNDYGEPFFAGSNKAGYDAYSIYAAYQGKGFIRSLVLGSYRASMGQGLIMGSGFLTGKLTTLPTVAANSVQLRPHASTDEYNYLQGAGTTIVPLKDFTLTAFYSRRKIDGTVNGDVLQSINTSGYHRIQSEIDREAAAVMQTTGSTLRYNRNTAVFSLNALYYHFNKDYQRTLRYYNVHYFRGYQGHNVSLDYRVHFRHTLLSGEVAADPKGHIATLHTVHYLLPQGWQAVGILRHYDYRYASMFANAFEEGGYVQNETGAYIGLTGTPLPHLTLTAFADFFRFPKPKYMVHTASQGYEMFLQAVYKLHQNTEILAYYRFKDKGRDLSSSANDDEASNAVYPYRTHRARLQLRIAANKLQLKTLLQGTIVGYGRHVPSKGFLLGQTADYTALPIRVSLSGFYFHTDDYASRLYAYEKGLLYSFSYPAYDGHGLRYAATLRYDISNGIMIMAKYGQTIYFDRSQISSGTQQINASHRQDISLQLRVKI